MNLFKQTNEKTNTKNLKEILKYLEDIYAIQYFQHKKDIVMLPLRKKY